MNHSCLVQANHPFHPVLSIGSSDQLQRKVFGRDKVVGEDDVDVELEAEAEDVGVGARANEVPRKNHEDRDFKIPGDVAVTDLEY